LEEAGLRFGNVLKRGPDHYHFSKPDTGGDGEIVRFVRLGGLIN
jgi:hypothetical protein